MGNCCYGDHAYEAPPGETPDSEEKKEEPVKKVPREWIFLKGYCGRDTPYKVLEMITEYLHHSASGFKHYKTETAENNNQTQTFESLMAMHDEDTTVFTFVAMNAFKDTPAALPIIKITQKTMTDGSKAQRIVEIYAMTFEYGRIYHAGNLRSKHEWAIFQVSGQTVYKYYDYEVEIDMSGGSRRAHQMFKDKLAGWYGVDWNKFVELINEHELLKESLKWYMRLPFKPENYNISMNIESFTQHYNAQMREMDRQHIYEKGMTYEEEVGIIKRLIAIGRLDVVEKMSRLDDDEKTELLQLIRQNPEMRQTWGL